MKNSKKYLKLKEELKKLKKKYKKLHKEKEYYLDKYNGQSCHSSWH